MHTGAVTTEAAGEEQGQRSGQGCGARAAGIRALPPGSSPTAAALLWTRWNSLPGMTSEALPGSPTLQTLTNTFLILPRLCIVIIYLLFSLNGHFLISPAPSNNTPRNHGFAMLIIHFYVHQYIIIKIIFNSESLKMISYAPVVPFTLRVQASPQYKGENQTRNPISPDLTMSAYKSIDRPEWRAVRAPALVVCAASSTDTTETDNSPWLC